MVQLLCRLRLDNRLELFDIMLPLHLTSHRGSLGHAAVNRVIRMYQSNNCLCVLALFALRVSIYKSTINVTCSSAMPAIIGDFVRLGCNTNSPAATGCKRAMMMTLIADQHGIPKQWNQRHV